MKTPEIPTIAVTLRGRVVSIEFTEETELAAVEKFVEYKKLLESGAEFRLTLQAGKQIK